LENLVEQLSSPPDKRFALNIFLWTGASPMINNFALGFPRLITMLVRAFASGSSVMRFITPNRSSRDEYCFAPGLNKSNWDMCGFLTNGWNDENDSTPIAGSKLQHLGGNYFSHIHAFSQLDIKAQIERSTIPNFQNVEYQPGKKPRSWRHCLRLAPTDGLSHRNLTA
jgi:hypothetical protein